MIKSTEEIIIYESPDGGKTVYARKIGDTVRTLDHLDSTWLKEIQIYERWEKLKPAVYMADNDKSLDDAIKTVEILYALKKKENT